MQHTYDCLQSILNSIMIIYISTQIIVIANNNYLLLLKY